MRKKSSGRRGVRTVGIGKFGKWLEINMKEYGYTCEKVGSIMKISRQCVVQHIRKLTCPGFPTVVAYCWAFSMKDDPEDIWKLVEEDWG